MTVKINTKDGQIELTDEVIATVVGGAATEIFGVVGMASKNVYTVLSYGTKISEVSKNIQERVKFSLENQLGITTDTVNVYIQNIKIVGE